MRILQIITSLQIGRTGHVVVHPTKLLRQEGYAADVIVFSDEHTAFMRELEEMGYRIYKFGRGFYNLSYIPELEGIMQEYDIIHTHNPPPRLFATITNIGLGKVLITTEYFTNNRKWEHPMFSFVDKWMYGKYTKVVTISKIAEERLCLHLGLESNQPSSPLQRRIVIINSRVDVNAFYHTESLPDLVHQGKFVTMMVAGFREAKDQETVIRTIALLPDGYALWLVGDGIRRPEIEVETVRQNVTERVKLLGIRSGMPQVLRSADITVMPPHWERLSLSSIEGMSSDKPFAVNEVSGLKKITVGYGILFPYSDAETLADVIEKLHDDLVYYHQVAKWCHQ